MTRGFMHLLRLPIYQRLEPSGDPDFFVKSDGTPALPTVLGQGEQVVEDVGLFARATNPNDPDTDVTICSGIFTHGVLGAVRAFTNPHVVGENVEAIREQVGRLTNFAVLFRVNVIGGRVATPRLSTATLDCVALD